MQESVKAGTVPRIYEGHSSVPDLSLKYGKGTLYLFYECKWGAISINVVAAPCMVY